jgi:hypothetical protein
MNVSLANSELVACTFGAFCSRYFSKSMRVRVYTRSCEIDACRESAAP